MGTLARRCAVAAAIAALIAGAIAGLASPHDLTGAGGWSLAVGGVLWGYGAAARRALGVTARLGEQLLLGTAAWILLSGVLLAAGVASRGPLFVLAGLGLALAIAELVALARTPPRAPAPDTPRWTTAHVVMGAALLGFLVLNLLGMIATRGNPYDDQVAYTAFVQRVLDCGDLAEPFSFRRISAFGGQTMLHALAALRGDVEGIDLLDRGIFQLIAVLIILDLAHRRRLHLGVTTGVVAFVLSLWDLNLNSAATWTGFACFTGAYAFASRDDVPPRAALVATAALCATACTLRQNYIAPAGLFALLVLAFHLRARARAAGSSWRDAWRRERRVLLTAAGAGAAIALPYMIAAAVAVGAVLYPITPGNANPVAPLMPTGGTFLDELRFFVQVTMSSEPIRVWWVLVPVMLVAKDPTDRRPWPALLIACGLGFVLLVHSFMLSDTYNLWRYAFGYLSPLATVFVLEAAASLPIGAPGPGEGPAAAPRLRVPAVAAFIAWAAVVVHFVVSRHIPIERFNGAIDNVKAASLLGSRKADPHAALYGELQAAVPEGERLAVLLDDPYHLDYARNPIVNLDLPGFVAPAPGLPSFTTPEHWRAYLRGQGIRYVAFIDGRHSSWLYRRTGWLWRIYADDELFRFIAAHMVDALDTLVELAGASRVLFQRHGFTVMDLGEAVPVEPPRGPPELVRMDAFARRLSEGELQSRAWQLASRRDVVFQQDGHGPTMIVEMPGLDPPGGPMVWQLAFKQLPEEPYRWLLDRTHVRLLGEGRHRLRMKLWVKLQRLYTTPTLVVGVDGVELARGTPDQDGMIRFDVPVACTGWCDLYLVQSAISEWWLGASDLRSIKLLEFEWTPAP